MKTVFVPLVKEKNVWREVRTLFGVITEKTQAENALEYYKSKGFETKIDELQLP